MPLLCSAYALKDIRQGLREDLWETWLYRQAGAVDRQQEKFVKAWATGEVRQKGLPGCTKAKCEKHKPPLPRFQICYLLSSVRCRKNPLVLQKRKLVSDRKGKYCVKSKENRLAAPRDIVLCPAFSCFCRMAIIRYGEGEIWPPQARQPGRGAVTPKKCPTCRKKCAQLCRNLQPWNVISSPASGRRICT